MKRFLVVNCVFFLVFSSAEAKLTRLAHFRAESLSAMSASATALALAAEQPMLGMMAMGGMQQTAQNFFGTVDQNKPVYAVVYFKGDLPDLSAMDLNQDASEMREFATNVVVAVMMPTVDTPEAFLKSKGAVDVMHGVFKEDDTTWWACKEGYAFMATDPEALGEAVQELRRGIDLKVSGMVFEMVVEKSVLGVYSDIIQGMSNRLDTPADALSILGLSSSVCSEFSELFAEQHVAQTKAFARLMGQVDRMAVGMKYDLVGGFFCEWFATYEEGSEIAEMVSSVPPLTDDLFSRIPVTSPFFAAMGNLCGLTGESELLVSRLREHGLPKIEDEGIRDSVADVLAEIVWMGENVESVVAFSDWDDTGRMVLVSDSRTRDDARYYAGSRKAMVGMMNVLKKVAPDQAFMTFDPEAMRGQILFENLFGFLADKFDADPDPEEMKEMLDVVDAIFGRTFEFSSAVHGDGIREIGQAADAAYSLAEASGSTVVADRVKALFPATSTIQPLQVGFVSLGALIKHLTPRVMNALDEENVAVIAALDHLSTVDGGGSMLVSWNEDSQFHQVMNVSAAEFKGLVKFFSALSLATSVESDWDIPEDDEAGKAEAPKESKEDVEEETTAE